LLDLNVADAQAEQSVVAVTKAYYPKDSLRVNAEVRANEWLKSLPSSVAVGLQRDPYGMIAVRARHDSVARRAFAAHLAAPGQTLADRAYTLALAATAFASADYPERLPIAEQYVAQLDSLGPDAAYWQFSARRLLIEAYYRLGRGADVARVGVAAFSRVPRMPYEQRDEMFEPGIALVYAAVIDALSGRPDGRATIRTMNRELLAAVTPPPDLVARDSSFLWMSDTWRSVMQGNIDMSERVGQEAQPLVSNYWVNRGTTRDSQTVSVRDGKIRVIEIGYFGCGSCVAAVPALERLHQQYPGVEFVWMTHGDGIWGNRLVDPKVEADRLAEHFVKYLHATFPIGIAKPVWVPADDGGSTAEVQTPTWQAGQYPQSGKPTFYIVDAQGIIRRTMGGFDRDVEKKLEGIIQYLQHEQRSAGGVSAPSSTSSSTATHRHESSSTS